MGGNTFFLTSLIHISDTRLQANSTSGKDGLNHTSIFFSSVLLCNYRNAIYPNPQVCQRGSLKMRRIKHESMKITMFFFLPLYMENFSPTKLSR